VAGTTRLELATLVVTGRDTSTTIQELGSITGARAGLVKTAEDELCSGRFAGGNGLYPWALAMCFQNPSSLAKLALDFEVPLPYLVHGWVNQQFQQE
jgi:hypothetical protein